MPRGILTRASTICSQNGSAAFCVQEIPAHHSRCRAVEGADLAFQIAQVLSQNYLRNIIVGLDFGITNRAGWTRSGWWHQQSWRLLSMWYRTGREAQLGREMTNSECNDYLSSSYISCSVSMAFRFRPRQSRMRAELITGSFTRNVFKTEEDVHQSAMQSACRNFTNMIVNIANSTTIPLHRINS